jgi:hypothetical protein
MRERESRLIFINSPPSSQVVSDDLDFRIEHREAQLLPSKDKPSNRGVPWPTQT